MDIRGKNKSKIKPRAGREKSALSAQGKKGPDLKGRVKSWQVRDGAPALDMAHYTPGLLAIVNNLFFSTTSQVYLSEFGLGIVEWRILAMLAIESHIPARRISEGTSIDKAAVSRSLIKLEEAGYAKFKARPSDERRKEWALSSKGRRMHDKMLVIALEREQFLTANLSEAEIDGFNKTLRKMLNNLGETAPDWGQEKSES